MTAIFFDILTPLRQSQANERLIAGRNRRVFQFAQTVLALDNSPPGCSRRCGTPRGPSPRIRALLNRG